MSRFTKVKGFTLIELLVVVAIIGIIASIALPSYQRYIDTTFRNDAQAALLSLGAHMERRFTENNSYCDSADGAESGNCTGDDNAVGDLGAPIFFSNQVPRDGGPAIYNLTLQTVSNTAFEIRAVRTAGARMANDECGDFTLTHTGLKGQVNMTLADCW